MKSLVNYQEIEKAYNRISNYATKTPLLSSDLLNKEFSSNIFIKAENLQKIGAFKFRGAMNSILKLNNDKKNVLAWSSGNHAQAIASACLVPVFSWKPSEINFPDLLVMTAPTIGFGLVKPFPREAN